MKILIAILIASFTPIWCNAQVIDLLKQDTSAKVYRWATEVVVENKPVYLVSDIISSPEYIISEHIIERQESVKKYPEAKSGLLIVTIKPGLKFMTLSELLDEYHIKGEDRKLKVYVNHIQVDFPLSLIAVKGSIANVTVVNRENKKAKAGERAILITRVPSTVFNKVPKGSKRLQLEGGDPSKVL